VDQGEEKDYLHVQVVRMLKKQYEETSEYQIMVTQLRCQFPISLVGENNLNTVNAIQAVLSNGNVRVHVTPRKKNSTNPKL
jgi:hypothetical protein